MYCIYYTYIDFYTLARDLQHLITKTLEKKLKCI